MHRFDRDEDITLLCSDKVNKELQELNNRVKKGEIKAIYLRESFSSLEDEVSYRLCSFFKENLTSAKELSLDMNISEDDYIKLAHFESHQFGIDFIFDAIFNASTKHKKALKIIKRLENII